MANLRNTIAHILEHKQHLAEANEATIQQYVILPILRTLGWDHTNLASIEVLPEYAVPGGQVDYALKVGQKLTLFIECKKWNEPLDKHENQIVTYAVKAGMPIAGLTNGKIWRFYFSWIEGTSVSDRIFCEIDIEDREAAISDFEKYLLKSNVASGEAGLNAEIALEEKEKTDSSKPNSIDSNADLADYIIDDNFSKQEEANILKSAQNDDGERTIARRGTAKMTEDQVREIRTRRAAGETLTNLAKAFDMSPTGIRNIVERNTWKHVE